MGCDLLHLLSQQDNPSAAMMAPVLVARGADLEFLQESPAFAMFSPSERMKWSPLELAVEKNKAKTFHSLLTLHPTRDVPIPDIKGLIDRAASSSQT
jgi:hypothetical protein